MQLFKMSVAVMITVSLASHSSANDKDKNVRVANKTAVSKSKATAKAAKLENTKPKNTDLLKPKKTKPHPLDAAIEIAHEGLERMKTIRDYKAKLIRRERTNGKLSPFEYSNVKIRNAQPDKNIPFSIYMGFTKPRSINGREAIWVKGRNSDKIIAHEAGAFLGKITVYLNPTGPIAMRGNRYPMYEAGFKVLAERLIEKADREKAFDEVEVNIVENKMVLNRSSKMIEVIHPVQRDHFDFHIARIYIDDELQLPTRYEAYDWPEDGSDKPVLLEQYLWTDIELNVGLTDDDFNPRSEKYNYCFTTPPRVDPNPIKVAKAKQD